ncbi:S53 family peptidase [Legionella maioricensis]|uniref:S53 family peptidase n=1 Tax=Legionella maioricensis TaxID=2896528 RepID=A0A9X2D406_9GAMM|nr:S53 family peptidase [Legionella maioricensis]MCL9685137.1 S53 family peptidase [Legionella maioricensis]MCL9688350.1 S53 family peptidase [Legionella maioricensis]
MMKRWSAVLLSLIGFTTIADAKSVMSRMELPSPGASLIQQAKFIAPMNSKQKINFTVWLKLRNKEQLDQLTNDIYNPNSANYQKFLTYDEFNQHYAPSQEVENKVLHYFTAQKMRAKIVNHSVRVTATVAQIEQVLQIKLNQYRYQNRTVYANATPPTLSLDVAQEVAEISGLSNIVRYLPALRARPTGNNSKEAFKSHDLNFVWDSFIPSAQPTTRSFTGFTGPYLQTAYNLAQIAPIQGNTINGAGQTLVIIDACGSNSAAQITADANLYNGSAITPLNLTGTSRNFAVINPDGSDYTTCGTPGTTGWESEIALDVEASHTLAYGANTVLVLAASDTAPLDAAVHDVINTLISNNYTIAGFSNAYVVSNSWGISELSAGHSPAMEAALQTAAAFGISFNFSTGDCGDGTYNSSWPCSAAAEAYVEFPASSAFTTAVGGTSAFVDNNWNYAFEALWGSYYSGNFYAGTTGGISKFYGPVSWQSSIMNFTAGGYNNGTVGFYNKRAVPDIAMLADPYTGLTIYEGGQSFVYGGTSLACPLFSGTLTLLNQERMLLNGNRPRPIGQAAPYLYTNNSTLLNAQALRLISPPHLIIEGARRPPAGAPLSAFKIYDTAYGYELTFGWDSSMTLAPENQFWNDGVGVGSPYLPNFIPTMATM